MTSVRSRGVGLHHRPDPQHAGRHDHVVQAAHPRRGRIDVARDLVVVADVEPHRPPVDLDPGSLAPRLVRDAQADAVGATHDVQPRAGERGRGARLVGRGDGPHLEHPVGQHQVDPGGDLEVHLVAGDGQDARPRNVAKDQAAVVGGPEIAHGGRGLVRLREDALAEHLWRLAAPVAGAIGDLDDAIAVDDDEGVVARDHRVGGIRGTARDGLDRTDDDLDRHEGPDRVVDDDDIVVGGIEAQESVPRALVARLTAGHDRCRDGQPGPGDDRSRFLEPVRMRDDDHPIDPRRGNAPDAAQEDLLAGEAHELLGHLGAEADAVTAGEEDRVDSHRSSLPRTRMGLIASELTPDVSAGRSS